MPARNSTEADESRSGIRNARYRSEHTGDVAVGVASTPRRLGIPTVKDPEGREVPATRG